MARERTQGHGGKGDKGDTWTACRGRPHPVFTRVVRVSYPYPRQVFTFSQNQSIRRDYALDA